MAELLDHHQQHMGGFVVDQMVEEILDPVERLVAGGDRKRDRDIARVQGARSTVAMAPLCDTMPTLRRPAGGTGAQALKVSGMPST